MNIHSQSYPHATTPVDPNAKRLPVTLFEHFRADPRGATSFPKWLDDRVWELLQRAAQVEFVVIENDAGTRWHWLPLFGTVNPATAAQCLSFAIADSNDYARRVVLFDGTVIKEWSKS